MTIRYSWLGASESSLLDASKGSIHLIVSVNQYVDQDLKSMTETTHLWQ